RPRPAPAEGDEIQPVQAVAQNTVPQQYQPLPAGPGQAVELPTPVVTMRVHAPANAAAGQELEDRLVVENRSRAAAPPVTVLANRPAGARFVRSQPPATAQSPELQWDLGTLGPGVRQEVRATVQPGDGPEVRFVGRVRFDHGQVVTTRLVKPRVAVKQFGP